MCKIFAGQWENQRYKEASSPNLILKYILGWQQKYRCYRFQQGTLSMDSHLSSKWKQRTFLCVCFAMTALQWKKDIFAVTLSFDADVWLKSPDPVSKIDVQKLEQGSWFIYVFLWDVNLHIWALFLLKLLTKQLIPGYIPYSFSLLWVVRYIT